MTIFDAFLLAIDILIIVYLIMQYANYKFDKKQFEGSVKYDINSIKENHWDLVHNVRSAEDGLRELGLTWKEKENGKWVKKE